MTDEIKGRITKYLDLLEDGVKKGGDFVADKAPETIRQLLAWEFWAAIAAIVMCVIVFIFCVWVCKKIWPYINPALEDGNPGPMFGFISSISVIITSLIIFYNSVFTTLKVAIAPNVFLLEYITTMIKNTK